MWRFAGVLAYKHTAANLLIIIIRHHHQLCILTHQMQNGVDHLPVGHLADFDEPDEQPELEVVRRCHADNLLGPLDLGEGRCCCSHQIL